jgi:hypothetical protein
MALVLLVVLGLAAHLALRPQPLQRAAAWRRSALALVAWAVPCVLLFSPETRALHVDELSDGFSRGSLSCFAYGSALAAPSFALLWSLDREPRVSPRVGALGAGIVAIVANLILMLHCTSTQPGHLLVGHFAIGLVWFALAQGVAIWAERLAWVK